MGLGRVSDVQKNQPPPTEWICYHAETAAFGRGPETFPSPQSCPVCGWSPPCSHIWFTYDAGEDATAVLSAPESEGVKWTEAVRICTLCDLIEPVEGSA